MHNRMNNTYSLQSKQKIKIKLLKNRNRKKGLEQIGAENQ